VLFITGTPDYIADKTYRDENEAKPADFAWATIVNEPLMPVPVPPAYPVQSAPGPLNPPAPIVAALDAAVPDRDTQLESPDTAVRILRRKLKDATVIMLFNESDHPVKNALALRRGGSQVVRWDAETGKTAAVAGDAAHIALDLKPYETAFYVVK
jgi:hypothetical protein